MSGALTRATYRLSEADLLSMVLDKEQLPSELHGFEPVREGVLDNATLTEMGGFDLNADDLGKMGRITGYTREFVTTTPHALFQEGTDLAVATLPHLFDSERAVSQWISEVFVPLFEQSMGRSEESGQRLLRCRRFNVDNLQDEAVGMEALNKSPEGLVSSAVVDFRVGRLLGVVYLVSLGDVDRKELAKNLAVELERNMVRVVLGSS